MTPRTGVIIVAGGGGHRMGGGVPKQFRLLGGVPVLARTINAFAEALPEATIVAVLPAEHVLFWKNLSARFDIAFHAVAEGGPERFHSVRNGLAALPDDVELIAVHDGVRPLATPAMIRRTAEAAALHGAAIPVIVPADSFRETDGDTSRPVDRSRLRAVQTPQIFEAALLRKAYETEFSPDFTDDASVVERSGCSIFLCEGERRNFKITTPEDLLSAEALLAAEETEEEERTASAEADKRSPASAGRGSAASEASSETPVAGLSGKTTDTTVRRERRECAERSGVPRDVADTKPASPSEPDEALFGGGAGGIR